MEDLTLTTILTILTVLIGLFNFMFPRRVAKLVGIKFESLQGFLEVRSVYSGVFLGLGIGALIINSGEAYDMLGAMWLGVGLMRLISIMLYKAPLEPNATTMLLLGELMIGILLIVD